MINIYFLNYLSFQLIQQVSGRAGRSKEQGEVLIQTYNSKSTAVNQIITGDYEIFYNDQVNDRKQWVILDFLYRHLNSRDSFMKSW